MRPLPNYFSHMFVFVTEAQSKHNQQFSACTASSPELNVRTQMGILCLLLTITDLLNTGNHLTLRNLPN